MRRCLTEAKAESLDAERMHALALTVHIECLRPALRGELLSLLLEGGAPPDARVLALALTYLPNPTPDPNPDDPDPNPDDPDPNPNPDPDPNQVEQGRTALMLAANNGRADLCAHLLDAGARAASTDGAGLTALHSACVDLSLVAEKVEEGIVCDPAAVVALLLAHGAPAVAETVDGQTALSLCLEQAQHVCARACADLLEAAATGTACAASSHAPPAPAPPADAPSWYNKRARAYRDPATGDRVICSDEYAQRKGLVALDNAGA